MNGDPGERLTRGGAVSALLLGALLLVASPATAADADDDSPRRYVAPYRCPDLDAPDTLIAVANPSASTAELVAKVRGRALRDTPRRLAAGDDLTITCGDLPDGIATSGIVTFESNVPLDVVTFLEPSAANVTVLAAITFQAVLDAAPADGNDCLATTAMGLATGQPATFVVLVPATPGVALNSVQAARDGLRADLTRRLVELGVGSEEAGHRAEQVIGESVSVIVDTDETYVAVLQGEGAEIQLVPGLDGPARDHPPPHDDGPGEHDDEKDREDEGTREGEKDGNRPDRRQDHDDERRSAVAIAIVESDSWDLWDVLAALLLGLLLLLFAWLGYLMWRRHERGGPAQGPGKAAYAISARLVGEREVDIDDRAATLEITVELVADVVSLERATKATLTLIFDFSGQRISFDGRTRGPLTFELPDLYPGVPVVAPITVATGFFAGADSELPSAAPGTYEFTARVASQPLPRRRWGRRLVGSQSLEFRVASD